MTPCDDSSSYMQMLTQLLQEATPIKGVRGEVGVTKKGSDGGGEKEGVIMEPTSIDLVGRSGLLSDLSAQGLQQAKLEGVGSFAGNLLILIEAKVPEERSEVGGQRTMKVTVPKQPLLMMSKRLMERRHWST